MALRKVGVGGVILGAAALAMAVATGPGVVGQDAASSGGGAMHYSMQVVGPLTASPTGLTPTALLTHYNFPGYPTKVNDSNGKPVNGQGEMIAIIANNYDPYVGADLAAFDTKFGVAPILGTGSTSCTLGHSYGAKPCFKLVYATTKPTQKVSDVQQEEDALDVEWAHAAAPGADIGLVEGAHGLAGYLAAIKKAVMLNAAVVSMSFISTDMGPSNADPYFRSGKATGFVAPVGEYQAGGKITATYCPSVAYPAGSSYVLAVGGTALGNPDSVWSYDWGGDENGRTGPGDDTVSRPGYQDNWSDVVYRAVPDVSLNAVNYAVYESLPKAGWKDVDGTSASAPVFAGLVADIDQARSVAGKKVLAGDALPAAMYSAASDLGRLPFDYIDGAYFNDITGGATKQSGCQAAKGFDVPTGLGTPNGADLVNFMEYDLP